MKTFKNAARSDAQCMDPLNFRIIGGRALPADEQGPNDTAWDPTHPLHVPDLLNPLDPLDVESVFLRGVIVPVEVLRYDRTDDIATVLIGRGRIRKARLANIRRKAEGKPLIMVKFVLSRETDALELACRMIDENLRRKQVSVLDQIQLAKQLMNRGASPEVAAQTMGVPQSRFDSWFKLEDHATPSVMEALRQNRMNLSTAIEIASIADPAMQDEKLGELLTAPKPTVRAAKHLVRQATGKETVTLPKQPEQKHVLARVDKRARGNEFLQGVKAALRWTTGEGVHKDLAKIIGAEDEDEE